ncbi:hypothetical protein NLI96_g1096 [Meripilus lineatus]|uniref:Uncharacterized protein n=1 Tax=Meripilus lineatus TaxID=2056292 RepID=A0AAD5VD55_9APHY|nr:hypothetical protein NLI96_g1096 [Physisporinus lineatus]
MADHYRMHLNNFLQSRGMANQLTWNVSSDGPPHNAMWRAVAFVRGSNMATPTPGLEMLPAKKLHDKP